MQYGLKRRLLVAAVATYAALAFVLANSPPVPAAQAVSPPEGPLSLTLEQAIGRALAHNRSLVSDRYDLESRNLSVASSLDEFSIKINPLSGVDYTNTQDGDDTVWQVGGVISKKFQTGVRAELRPSVAFSGDSENSGVGFSLSVPLLRGRGKMFALDNVYGSRFSKVSALRSHHRHRVETIVETVSLVYSILRQEELIKLYEEQLGELQTHLRVVGVKEQAGLARSMDMFRARIRVKDVQDSLAEAREQAVGLEDQLKKHIAISLDQDLHVRAPLEYSMISVPVKEAVETARDNRIDLKQEYASLLELDRKEKLARKNIMPELTLQSDYTVRGQSSDVEDRLFFEDDIFSIRLVSTTDLSRSSEKTAWEQSRINVRKQKLNIAAAEDRIAQEVRQVLRALEKSSDSIQLRRQQVEQARGKLRLSDIKFRYGKADNFDLIESQTELQRAQSNLVSDEIEYIINGYKLRAALGTLLEPVEI